MAVVNGNEITLFNIFIKRKNTIPELKKPFIFYGIQKVVPNDGVILVYTKRDQNKRLLFENEKYDIIKYANFKMNQMIP